MTTSIREQVIVQGSCPECGAIFSFDQNCRGQFRRKFCTSECRTKHNKRLAREKKSPREDKLTKCSMCSKEFFKWDKSTVSSFCSEECARKRAHVLEEIQCCLWCGGELNERSKTYCSFACRIHHKREELDSTSTPY